MKQYTLSTDNPEELIALIDSIRDEPEYQNASDRLLLVAAQEPPGPQESQETAVRVRLGRLLRTLEGIKIVGFTMSTFQLSPEKASNISNGAVYTLLLFERSRVGVHYYDCRGITAEEAGRRFQREIRYREHIAGIMVFSAGISMELDRFLAALEPQSLRGVPIIGAEAGSDETPGLFGGFGESDCGVAALVLSGRSLQLRCDYDMGWKPIGKEMRVTSMDGSYCVRTIDGENAASIYEKYLGVSPDHYFVENVREFPLVTEHGQRKVVRCPSGYDRDGRLHFNAKLREGETVRLSYANPRRLLEDTRRYAAAMQAFDPQALLLIVCENRARFLGDLTAADMESYTAFMPQTAWLRGYAGIMLDNLGGGVVNSAILSVGLREGFSSRHGGNDRPAVAPDNRRLGAIPLNERLARFLEQTTNELEDMAIEADAANHAKSAFLSNMSHEIRTPINAILGMNEMVLRESTEEQILAYSNNIRIAGMSLLGIINDILDFSKIEAGMMDLDPAEYEVASLVSDLVNLIRLRADEKGLALEVRVDPGIPHLLYGDEMRIKQIITNLLTNAVKYTEQGRVLMTIDYEQASAGEIELRVAVKDTGHGIRAEDLDRLFNAFDRIDKEHTRNIEGTGLGLNITQYLLSLMGSRLEVESVYGEGSTFAFSLRQPVVEWQEIGEGSAAPHGERRSRNRSENSLFIAPDARILVVDDAPMNLSVISGLLKRTRVHVDTAGGGEECLEKFGRERYDMVFLDHRMPGMDGMETMGQLLTRYPEETARTPVISLTANALSGARELYLAAGFSDYLTKPVMADELEETLLKFLPEEKVLREFDSGGEPEPERVPEWLAAVPSLELKEGLAHCGGPAAYLEALRIFAASVQTRAGEIERACAAGDIADYTIKVHALKSMARAIGAKELGGLAARLEAAGDARDFDAIYSQTGKLLAMYRRLERALRPALDPPAEDGNAPAGEAGGPPLDDDALAGALEAVRDLAMAYDDDSIHMVLEQLPRVSVPERYVPLYDALADALRRVDWDAIQETANAFLKEVSEQK